MRECDVYQGRLRGRLIHWRRKMQIGTKYRVARAYCTSYCATWKVPWKQNKSLKVEEVNGVKVLMAQENEIVKILRLK